MAVDRNADTATVTAEAIVEDGGEAVAVTCDIGSPDDLVASGADVEQREGRLNVLVNNAGIRHYGPITESGALAWDDIFAVNLRGAALCARQVLRYPGDRRRQAPVRSDAYWFGLPHHYPHDPYHRQLRRPATQACRGSGHRSAFSTMNRLPPRRVRVQVIIRPS